MRRFYTERTNLRPKSSVKLPADEAAHIRDSLRLEAGDEIILFNGLAEFHARLGLVTKDVVMANIIDELNPIDPSLAPKFELIMAMGMVRSSNFETALQKATEAGVSQIYPLVSEYSQKDKKTYERKKERWEKIILEACKQSERVDVPQLHAPVNVEQLCLRKKDTKTKLLFTLHRQLGSTPQDTEQLLKIIPNIKSNVSTKAEQANEERKDINPDPFTPILYVIGPEGGFSPQEHEVFDKHGFKNVEILSGRVLKAETAAVVATALLRELLDD